MKNIILLSIIGAILGISLLAVSLSTAADKIKVKGKIVLSTQNEIQISDLGNMNNDKPDWKIILQSKDFYNNPEWSPDGKYIAMGYMSWEELQKREHYQKLAIIKADGSDLQYIVTGPEYYDYPSWSPDGKHIAMIAYTIINLPKNGFKPIANICLYDMETKSFKKMDGHRAGLYKPSWSSDGRLLTYSADDLAIVVHNLETGEIKTFSEKGFSPIFHSDGKRIFYVTKGNNALCSINIDGTDNQVIKKAFFDYPVKFTKDGNYLLYAGSATTYFMALRGLEVSSLNILDMKTLKSYESFRSTHLHGASFVEAE